MGEVECRDWGLAHIGVDMAWQGAEPGFDRIGGLSNAGEIATLNNLLDKPQLFVGEPRFGIPDRDRRGDIGLANQIGAEFLQSSVGVHRLVVGIGIEKRRGFIGHDLLEDGSDGFTFGKPLTPDFGEEARGVGLVEHDRAG